MKQPGICNSLSNVKRAVVNCLLERLRSFPQQNQLSPRLLTYIHIRVLYNRFSDIHMLTFITTSIIFKILSTNIPTFCLLDVISISAKVSVEDAKAIYTHLWAHKSYAFILEISPMYAILGSICHPSLYSVSMVRKELLYQI